MNTLKTIPVLLAKDALKRNLVKELLLIVKIKNNCDGWFSSADEMFKVSGIKVRKTFDKQFSSLISLGWIYRSSTTGNYNVLSFHKICKKEGYNDYKRLQFINTDSIPMFRALLFSGVVTSRVNQVRYYFERTKGGRTDALNGSKAFISVSRRGVEARRYGVGMESVSNALGYSRQYMSKMLNAAARYGFLVVSPIFYKGRQLNNEIRGLVNFVKRGREKRVSRIGELRGDQRLSVIAKWTAYVSGRSVSKPYGRKPLFF